MSKNTETGIVPIERYQITQFEPADLAKTVMENVGGGIDQFDLDRIRVPGGGGITWEIPTLEGEEHVAQLEGVIVGWRDVRAYWKEAFDDTGGGTPPDCKSDDALRGEGDPGGDCTVCPLAKYGSSEKGEGQACRAMRLVFLVRPQTLLPLVLVVPPSSLKNVRKFFLRLVSNGNIPFYGVVARFGLSKDKSRQGITYSKIVPQVGQVLSADETRLMREYAESLAPTFDAVDVTAEDAREEAPAAA